MDMAKLSKLTVAKLRDLCKESGLSNYSKLPKAALLAKLDGVGLVSLNSKLSSHSMKQTPCEKGIIVDELLAEIQSSDVGASILRSDARVPSSFVDESRSGPESSTVPKLSCADVLPPVSSRISDLKGSSMPVRMGSKRSSSAFSTTEKRMTPKRRKVSFKVPEIPIPVSVSNQHNRYLAKDLHVCTPQHRSEITPATSMPSHLLDSLDETLEGNNTITTPLNATPTTVPLLQEGSMASLIAATSLQRRVSNITEAAPLRKSKLGDDMSASFSSISKRVPHQPRMGLSRNIVISCSKFPALSSPAVDHSPSPNQNINFSDPLSILQESNQSQTDVSHPQPSLKCTAASMPLTMEASILSSLKSISLPPSISQRKRLPLLSLALSYSSDNERKNCILVSKLFRYAVYLSAQEILRYSFSGKRLTCLICSLSTRGLTLNMTNLWPYLRCRQQEASQRNREFLSGWAAKFIREMCHRLIPMTERLWRSPDHEEQFLVVQRFIQTRICFALSFYGEVASNRWIASTVVDAQEVLANEIWSITINESRPDFGAGNQRKTYYVLYQTCEVIGHPLPETTDGGALLAGNAEQSDSCRISLRADWSAYIALRLPPATRHLYLPLMEYIRGTNMDDFERGIARGWIKRLHSQGHEGREKLLATERYILGCVVGNSISGEYRSLTNMALEWDGVTDARENEKAREDQSARDINLFLPERHYVESVHFTNKRSPLHPALMVVQTAGRQEGSFVLRENGVVIGEDEQVPETWMRLLGCTVEGTVV